MQETANRGFGHIDLRSLRFLALLLELRSVTRAGEAMGLSQPAASRLLAQLRRALDDDPLIMRGRNGVYVLTARAVEILPKLEEALNAAEKLFAPDVFDPLTSKRTVRIASTDYGSAIVLTGLARDLATTAPAISLEVRPLTTDTFTELEDGRIDLALYTDDELPSGFHREKLFTESFACVLRRDHPVLEYLSPRGFVPIKKLAKLARVLMVYIDDKNIEIDDPLSLFGEPAQQGAHFTPYFLSAPLLLAGSNHVLCIPRRAAQLVATMADLTVIDVPEVAGFTYCITWHDRAGSDKCLAWLRRRIAACTL